LAFEHVLFPVDFSSHCTAFAGYVQAVARGSGSRLTLLHVLEIPPAWYSDLDAAFMASVVDLQEIKAQRQQQLDAYLGSDFREFAPARMVFQGDAAAEIEQFARKENVSLIVMPTHGRGPFRTLLLGSVTAKVLYDATCPVCTSSHTEHVRPASYPPQTIVCAVDLPKPSEDALQWALRFASEQKATVHMVHGIHVNEESANRGVLEVRRYLSENAEEQWADLTAKLGIKAPLRIAYGGVAEAVRKAAHDLHADMVIIGRGHTQERLGRLRTNSYAIIRESPCPVIRV
jgi:nucleotide-binding universal stress UspA family protein